MSKFTKTLTFKTRPQTLVMMQLGAVFAGNSIPIDKLDNFKIELDNEKNQGTITFTSKTAALAEEVSRWITDSATRQDLTITQQPAITM